MHNNVDVCKLTYYLCVRIACIRCKVDSIRISITNYSNMVVTIAALEFGFNQWAVGQHTTPRRLLARNMHSKLKLRRSVLDPIQ